MKKKQKGKNERKQMINEQYTNKPNYKSWLALINLFIDHQDIRTLQNFQPGTHEHIFVEKYFFTIWIISNNNSLLEKFYLHDTTSSQIR